MMAIRDDFAPAATSGARAVAGPSAGAHADSAPWQDAYERQRSEDPQDADGPGSGGEPDAFGTSDLPPDAGDTPCVPGAAFDAGCAVPAGGDRTGAFAPLAAPASGEVAALAFTAQTLQCLAGQAGFARLHFECRVQGGPLDGAVLQISGDAAHGGIASIVVRLPRERWAALHAQRAELARALVGAVPPGVVVEVVPDDASSPAHRVVP